MLRTILAGWLLVITAMPSIAQPNPSGVCGVRSDGSRLPYHYTQNDVWMPDCRNPLRREYWRVFLKGSGSAYIIPRPDGAAPLSVICSDPSHKLRGVVDKYPLCQPAASREQVRIVNSMKPSDALLITHFLHKQLKFKTVTIYIGALPVVRVTPYPIPSDIADVCALERPAASAKFNENCRIEMEGLKSGRGGPYWAGDEAVELAARLNELYDAVR